MRSPPSSRSGSRADAAVVVRDGVLDRLRAAGESLFEALAREEYRVAAGLQPELTRTAVYARHSWASAPAALEAAVSAWREAPDDRARDLARRLLEWQAGLAIERAVAPLEERELAWRTDAAVVLPDGRVLAYEAIAGALAATADRDERLRIEQQRADLVARELAPLRRERLLRELDAVEGLGLGEGYVTTLEAVSGIALAPLAERCRDFLRESEAMWADVRPTFLRRAGVPPREAVRADVLAAARAPAFDAGFPAADLLPAVRQMLGEAGMDPEAGGRIRYDLGARPGQRPVARCVPVRIPDEVYLVCRPEGGAEDWRALLHELGRALHFANMQRALPFEERWLGDTSVTEGYARLLAHLVTDAGWLRRYTSLGRERIRDWRAHAAFVELYRVRWHCARLLYELELWSSALRDGSAPERYVELFARETGFRHDPADAYVDVESRVQVARHLRAWMLQAVLAETLRERYDEDWYRNPACGAFLVSELFAAGQPEDADALATRLSGGGISFAPLLRQLEVSLS